MLTTADQLIAAMSEPVPLDRQPTKARRDRTRDVYEGYREGKYPTEQFYLTYSGGRASRAAVDEAVRRGLIVPTWPNIETGSWSLPDQAERNRIRYEEVTAKRAGAAASKVR